MVSLFGLISEYGILDLFRYSAPGVPDTTVNPPDPYTSAYFSVDGGNTPLDDFNTTPGTDLGDWAPSAGHDAFLAVDGNPNSAEFTSVDTTVMNVLGWNSAEVGTPCYCCGTLIRTDRGQKRVEEGAGIDFLPENGGGEGLRLRRPRSRKKVSRS